jgi:hypothetical protein
VDQRRRRGWRTELTRIAQDSTPQNTPGSLTFDRANTASSWLFRNQHHRGNTKYIAEAASHESGDGFRLTHDGCAAAGVGYCTANDLSTHTGHANWAPIMGNGYYQSS